ncbi:MAG: hypothetical protein Q9160_007834 [Pyrenula sp. 1 TL-2023]
MEVTKAKLRSTVEELIEQYETTVESKDREIAYLRGLNERSNQSIDHLREENENLRLGLRASSSTAQHGSPEPRENHESCREELRKSNARYAKLLKEAETQTQLARTLESRLEKTQEKVRKWQGWYLSDTPKPCSHQKKKNNPAKDNFRGPENIPRDAGSHNTQVSSGVGLSDDQSVSKSILEASSGNGSLSSYAQETGQSSSPDLPPHPPMAMTPSRWPKKAPVPEARHDSSTEDDHIPTSAPTEVVEEPENKDHQNLDTHDVSESLASVPMHDHDHDKRSQDNAEVERMQGKVEEGSLRTPIYLKSDSHGQSYKALSFSGAPSFNEIELDQSFQTHKHDTPRKRRRRMRAQRDLLPPESTKRHFSEPPTSQMSYTALHLPHKRSGGPPLREIDGNLQRILGINSKVEDEPPSKRQKTRQQKAVEAIPELAEDGEEYVREKPVSSTPAKSTGERQPWHNRLSDILEGKSPQFAVLKGPLNPEKHFVSKSRTPLQTSKHLLRSTPTVSEKEQIHSPTKWKTMAKETKDAHHITKSFTPGVAHPHIPMAWSSALTMASRKMEVDEKRILQAILRCQVLDDDWYSEAEKVLSRHRIPIPNREPSLIPANVTAKSRHTPKTPEQTKEPLRDRPLEQLTLSDFKINAAKNEGLPFAFTDVVRRRDLRQCLPGCTRPCCNDQFRALAANLPSTCRNGIFDSDPASADDDTEDLRLLCDFLGESDIQSPTIRALSRDDRQRLLVDARIKAAADKYGKMHRHRHARAKTPPGFWNADMPGTQEMEEERKAAKERMKEMVKERYQEAKRGNGLWMFADE